MDKKRMPTMTPFCSPWPFSCTVVIRPLPQSAEMPIPPGWKVTVFVLRSACGVVGGRGACDVAEGCVVVAGCGVVWGCVFVGARGVVGGCVVADGTAAERICLDSPFLPLTPLHFPHVTGHNPCTADQ